MNGAEAASSLFGPEEPASDPFASLGEESNSQPAASDLFNSNGAASTFDFGPLGDQYSEQPLSSNTQAQAPQTYAQPASHGFSSDPHSMGSNASTANQGAAEHWGGEHSQWDGQKYGQEHHTNGACSLCSFTC